MISVCMATYNGSRFIKQQILSILEQLSDIDELVISDDGSTDETLEIINNFKDSRIKLLHHTPTCDFSNHEKVTANFENALNHCRGDYIFLTDQDDVWKSNKVKYCLSFFEKFDFIFHNKTTIDIKGTIKEISGYKENPLRKFWICLLIKFKLNGCCMAFKRECLKFLLPFPKKLIAHDYWIGLLCLKLCRCTFIEDPLMFYRIYEGSVSYKQNTSFLYKLKYRYKLLVQIYMRIKEYKTKITEK